MHHCVPLPFKRRCKDTTFFSFQRKLFSFFIFFAFYLPCVFVWSLFQHLECATQLVRTRGTLDATADAIQSSNHIVNFLTCYQLADALQVTIAPAQKEYLLDNVMLIGCHVNQLRTSAVSLILYMFCSHIIQILCKVTVFIPNFQIIHEKTSEMQTEKFGSIRNTYYLCCRQSIILQ
jgi:hypothetical protein